ncbi:hypothetical protein Tco_0894654 [Tanacetum coccineum]|uniref:Uncharacterized protein n=1 Tax=Tanacetum coccineum TaxID=301880 RepID=A0ABQ5CET0_9ASTR
MESEEQLKAAEVLVAISRPIGLSIPGPIQTQPQQPTQGTDPKDKGKGIRRRKKEEVFEELKKTKPKTYFEETLLLVVKKRNQ